MWEVYRLTCIITNKSYVGKGIGKSRWLAHKRNAKKGVNTHLCNAIRKHGAQNFILTIEKVFETEHEAYAFETSIIDCEDLTHTGYNEVPGIIVHCDLDKVRLERAQTIKDGWSPARRQEQSRNYRGDSNPFFGRKHDESAKKRMSEASTHNINAHAKISAALKGHKVSQETRTKMSFSSKTRGKSLEDAFGANRAAEIKATLKSNQPDRRGEKHPGAKLSESDVVDIKCRSVDKNSDEILAKEYGVSTYAICKIRLGYSWKHLWIASQQ